MYRRFPIAVLVVSMAFVSAAHADTTTEGLIKTVDLAKRAIAFEKDSGFTVVLKWTAEQEPGIVVTMDGDKSAFKELKPGQKVRLSYYRESKELYGIAILKPPTKRGSPRSAAKLKEIRKLLKEGENEDAAKRLDELIKDLGE
jgi:hypothetical protein